MLFPFKGQKRPRGFFGAFFGHSSKVFGLKVTKNFALLDQANTIFSYFIIFSPRHHLGGVIEP
jgi:hypothetical protein